jgi:hypothetical protein
MSTVKLQILQWPFLKEDSSPKINKRRQGSAAFIICTNFN